MTGLISRSKKRALNAMKLNRFRDFTVVKSNDPTSTSTSIIDETTTADDNRQMLQSNLLLFFHRKKNHRIMKVKMMLKEATEQNDNEDDDHGMMKRKITIDGEKKKPIFTVTIDPPTKYAKDSRNKSNETSTSAKE